MNQNNNTLLKFLVPQLPLRDLPIMFGYALLGALLAGAYGIVHDQVTYSIGPEYFANFKFKQFHWANLGLGDRPFVSCIGFLATWWIGIIVAWVLSRRMIPNQTGKVACRKILQGFVIVFATAFLFGVIGFLFGLFRGPDADYSNWNWAFDEYEIMDQWAFIRVAYIHNAGYVGGVVGLFLTFFLVRPGEKRCDADQITNEKETN